jgi:hypothetical protein
MLTMVPLPFDQYLNSVRAPFSARVGHYMREANEALIRQPLPNEMLRLLELLAMVRVQ